MLIVEVPSLFRVIQQPMNNDIAETVIVLLGHYKTATCFVRDSRIECASSKAIMLVL